MSIGAISRHQEAEIPRFPLVASGDAPPAPVPGGEALYLGSGTSTTFAMLHRPERRVQRAVGVIFCPLLGWDDLCTHRSRRAWAKTLAEAGYPAIRLDLPGTGDSPTSPLATGQIEAWTTAVSEAASLLVDEFGCHRVAAVGIGFGGTLAWLAAANGAPIDDLMLWAVPTGGRRLVRAIHVAAKLSINTHISPSFSGSADEALAAGGGELLLDEAGQVTTAETSASLAAIDLLKTPLPGATDRRALVLQRSAETSDADLVSNLQEAGVDVTVRSGDSYGRLMRYVQASELPDEVVADCFAWLDASPAAAPRDRDDEAPEADHPHRTSVEFEYERAQIRETAVSLDLPSGTVRGILTEPVDGADPELCAVFLSGGSDRRIGPNRMWVDTARRWAARGVAAIRIDPGGVGDSEGDERAWDRVDTHYYRSQVSRTIELLHALEARGLPGRFVLVGFCSGAYRSLYTALGDDRVAGVFAIGMPFFKWTWWTVKVRDSWLAVWEPKPGDSRAKIWVARVGQRLLKIARRGQHAVVRTAQPLPNSGEKLLRRLTAQGTEVLLLLKPASYAYEQLSMPRRRARLAPVTRLHAAALLNDDERFRPLASQHFVRDEIDAGLSRVIESERARAATPAAAIAPAPEVSAGQVGGAHAASVHAAAARR